MRVAAEEEEEERELSRVASRPRRGVKQMTLLNLAHSARSLLRAHSSRDTSSRGVRSYTLAPFPLLRRHPNSLYARARAPSRVYVRLCVTRAR